MTLQPRIACSGAAHDAGLNTHDDVQSERDVAMM
jgi:hypothetical protein